MPIVRRAVNKSLNRLARTAKMSQSKILLDRYRKVRNQTSRLIDDAYSDYFNKMFSSDMPSNHEFYRFIKSKKTENLGIPDLSSGTQTFSNDSEKAE